MDRDVILAKVESLERCVDRIRGKTPSDRQALAADVDAQDIIVLNLERAIQICVDVAAYILAELRQGAPMTMAEGFDRLSKAGVVDEGIASRMRKAVGFRNIAIHEYRAINWDMVYSIITEHLDDFRQFAAAIMQWMESQEDPK